MIGNCLVWEYLDAAGNQVGFGTLDLCRDYAEYAEDKFHCYIPVLGVHPSYQGRGYGSWIVRHLIAICQQRSCKCQNRGVARAQVRGWIAGPGAV